MISILLSLCILVNAPEPAEPEAWVLIVDPGESLFTRFGHSAFLIRGPNWPDERIYDFGHFEFSNQFMIDFLHGNAFYSLETRSLGGFLSSYSRERREVRAHRLRLEAQQVSELRDILEKTLNSPEKEYRYHHFADNCATRMRDVISQVTYGRWRLLLQEKPDRPWRNSLFDVLGSNSGLKYGLSLLLSSPMDRARTAWDGTYLPVQLEEHLLWTRGMTEDRPDEPFIMESSVLVPGDSHDHVSLIPPPLYFVFAVFLALLLLPLAKVKGTIWLQVSFLLVSLLFSILFAVMVFFHRAMDICAFNLNMAVFFPFLAFMIPFWIGTRVVRRRTLVFLLISMSFPLLVLLVRPFTLQRTAPYPEFVLIVYTLLLVEFIVWHLRARRRRKNVTGSGDTHGDP